MAVFSGLASMFHKQLTQWLLAPAGNQQFIYTSPGGGFDFIVRICVYTGFFLSIPVIVSQILLYFTPLVKKETMHFLHWVGFWSAVLACLGMSFGYFVGLSAGLNFLLHTFSTNQIQALISVQSYLSFVLVYLLGAAILFQLPLILLFINHIKPLKPGMLMGKQRWVILIAFVVGAMISPSPDVKNQTIMAAPIIAMYELSIVLIWMVNRKHRRPKKVLALLQKDAETREKRVNEFTRARQTWESAMSQAIHETKATVLAQSEPVTAGISPMPQLASIPQHATRQANRPRRYISDYSKPAIGRPVSPTTRKIQISK